MDSHPRRRDKLRRAVKKTGADALLVTNFTNVTYLTGFTGDDSYLLVRGDGEVVLSDPRYTTQLGEECPGVDIDIRPPGTNMLKGVGKAIKAAKIGRLAIEADSMTVGLQAQITEKLPKLEIVPTSALVEELREIKDKGEIARIREAVRQAERGFGVLRADLRLDKTEKQVANELEYQMRLFGARWRGFASIVGVGPRAALPHAVPSDRQIGQSDFVLVDWGADEGLYKSDLTRVLVTGKISARLKRIYEVVLKAQTKAIDAIRPGATGKEIDQIARDVIGKAGFGKNFGHGLGHGVGLDIHELPRLAANSKSVLRPGMVLTVEPGIYIPGWGGVRLEDDVLVTPRGHEVLTGVAKKLEDSIVG
ncbi:MAG: aminopeptidase P family protein [Candidatus Nealsonbacteria bacterium]|nr:aminopeptidase P family protein [Candidatus Nealsonbacteria bacterium]